MIAVGTNTAEQTVYKLAPRPLDINRSQGKEINKQLWKQDEDLHPLCVCQPAGCHHW